MIHSFPHPDYLRALFPRLLPTGIIQQLRHYSRMQQETKIRESLHQKPWGIQLLRVLDLPPRPTLSLSQLVLHLHLLWQGNQCQ
jgi:hypothetical protein